MSASKRISFAVAISGLSRIIMTLANLFFVPILFRYMDKEELGIWYLLGNSTAFLGLLGFGVAPILTRQIALAKGKSGIGPDTDLTAENQQEIGDWLTTGKTILQGLAFATFFVAWGSGYGLIQQLEFQTISPHNILFAWTLMCVGYAIAVWMSYLDCLLVGIGYVGWESFIATAINLLTIFANIVSVLSGGGLLALAVISIISALAQRFIILGFIRWRNPNFFSIRGHWNKSYAFNIVKPALAWWLTSLGAFSLYKTDQYFIALFEGTAQIALYHSTYAVISNLATFSLSLTISSGVFISQYWSLGQLDSIHRFIVKNCNFGLCLMASGFIFLTLGGKEFFEIWLDGAFIGYGILVIFLVSLTLDVQHGLLTGLSRETGDEKYAVSGMLAGVLNLIFTWLLIQKLGLIGVPLGTLFAQLLTNNWYGVYRPLVRLKFSGKSYLTKVILPTLTFAAIAYVAVFLIKTSAVIIFGYSQYIVFSSVFAGSGLAFCIGMVSYVLSKDDKNKIFNKIRSWKTQS